MTFDVYEHPQIPGCDPRVTIDNHTKNTPHLEGYQQKSKKITTKNPTQHQRGLLDIIRSFIEDGQNINVKRPCKVMPTLAMWSDPHPSDTGQQTVRSCTRLSHCHVQQVNPPWGCSRNSRKHGHIVCLNPFVINFINIGSRCVMLSCSFLSMNC